MAHDFFGNMSTSATSTTSGLVGGSTSCTTSVDASAYWTPVLYQNGVAITPERNLIYWSGLQVQDPVVTAPPAGLEMIPGTKVLPHPSRPRSSIGVAPSRRRRRRPVSDTPVNCAGTNGIELRITFPSCWDGTSLSGADQAYVVYPGTAGVCPSGHPVRIPTVIFHIVYPISSAAGLTLSMGPGQQGFTDTAHGDFINGWNQVCFPASSVVARQHPRLWSCDRPPCQCSLQGGPGLIVRARRSMRRMERPTKKQLGERRDSTGGANDCVADFDPGTQVNDHISRRLPVRLLDVAFPQAIHPLCGFGYSTRGRTGPQSGRSDRHRSGPRPAE